MKMQCVGVGTRRSGTSKTNRPYDMQPLYLILNAPDVVGHKTEEIVLNYLSGMSFPADIAPGDILEIGYDKRGFLVECSLVEKSTDKGKSNMKISSTQ